MKISAIILASGFSKRFKGNKLLTLYEGKPIVMHVIDKVLKQAFYEVIIVSQYEEVLNLVSSKAISKSVIKSIKNNCPEKGVSQSIYLGIQASQPCDAYMFFVGDTPFIQEETIREMMKRYKTLDEKETAILCPYYKGSRGNPVIFGKNYQEELMTLKGDEGGKQIIRRYPEKVVPYEINHPHELLDIDTQADLDSYIGDKKFPL